MKLIFCIPLNGSRECSRSSFQVAYYIWTLYIYQSDDVKWCPPWCQLWESELGDTIVISQLSSTMTKCPRSIMESRKDLHWLTVRGFSSWSLGFMQVQDIGSKDPLPSIRFHFISNSLSNCEPINELLIELLNLFISSGSSWNQSLPKFPKCKQAFSTCPPMVFLDSNHNSHPSSPPEWLMGSWAPASLGFKRVKCYETGLNFLLPWL